MNENSKKHYAASIKFLHWIIALLVIGMLCIGFFMDDFSKQSKVIVYPLHKSIGLTILFLTLIRFIWVQYRGKPDLPLTMKLWEKITSRIVQYSFYVLLIIMPLSGWIMSVAAGKTPSYFGLFDLSLPWIGIDKPLAEFMAESHETIAWILIALIILHVGGALKHHFIDKDNVLKSMWIKNNK